MLEQSDHIKQIIENLSPENKALVTYFEMRFDAHQRAIEEKFSAQQKKLDDVLQAFAVAKGVGKVVQWLGIALAPIVIAVATWISTGKH